MVALPVSRSVRRGAPAKTPHREVRDPCEAGGQRGVRPLHHARVVIAEVAHCAGGRQRVGDIHAPVVVEIRHRRVVRRFALRPPEHRCGGDAVGFTKSKPQPLLRRRQGQQILFAIAIKVRRVQPRDTGEDELHGEQP